MGIPGRIVTPRTDMDKRREEMAEKLGFDAYGAAQDMPDPVANAVNRMLDHIQLMDERMDKLCAEVQRLGGQLDAKPLSDLRAEDFSTLCSAAKKSTEKS